MKSCKAYITISIIVALVVAILALIPHPGSQTAAAYITHFFVSMLPVLGVAALLWYLCGGKKCCCKTTDGQNCSIK